jgi:hypothetical protein
MDLRERRSAAKCDVFTIETFTREELMSMGSMYDWQDCPNSCRGDLSHLSKEQQYYVGALQRLGRPSSYKEICAEHRRQHLDDHRTDQMLQARIRTELQRYCETSSQFKNFGQKKNLKIFTHPSHGEWWLEPEYEPKTAVEQTWIIAPRPTGGLIHSEHMIEAD